MRRLTAVLHALLAVAVALLTHRRQSTLDVRPLPAEGETGAFAARLAARVADAKGRHLETLGLLIREETVAIDGVDGPELPAESLKALLRCHQVLETRFPTVHAVLRRDVVGDASLLYEWTGSDPTLDPVVLIAHLDVVPVSKEQAAQWQRAPFGGEVVGGEVWGRGALDVKGRVVAHLAAVEALLAAGKRPRRTVYLAYGHDEEIGGRDGAVAMAAEVEQRLGGRRVAAVLDEGGAVTSGGVPGLKMEGAMVGTAEKGYAAVEFSASGRGGHAAWPPWDGSPATAVARALAVAHERPPAPRLTEPVEQMLRRAAPLMGEPHRTLFSSVDLLRPVIARLFTAATPKANALVRTTATATRLAGGEKDNVIPSSARAVLNVRILPGESVAQMLARMQALAAPFNVTAALQPNAIVNEPTPTSPIGPEVAAWAALERSFHRVYGFEEIVVLPYVMLGQTDSKHFVRLADAVYRMGQRLSEAQIATIHGVDERESAEGVAEQQLLFESFLELFCL